MILGAIVLTIGLAACSTETAEDASTVVEPTKEATSVDEDTSVAQPTTEPVEEPTDAPKTDETDSSESSDITAAFDKYGGVSEGDIVTTDSGLQVAVLEEGEGDSPESGQIVSVHYTGWLEDGTVFDSSVERGTPFQFPLGKGAVIAGWDEGIGLLNLGGRARLIIPSDLGYGERGSGIIPPDATLIFEVELLEILPGSPESPEEISEDDFTVTDTGLKYFDIETGSGPEPVNGQLVVLDFTLWLDDGTKLASSIDGGQALQYVQGSGELFPGFEEGIATMQVGGIRQLIIPPDLAYGETGAGGGQIPPNSTLIFEVELLEIQ
jgi:peptidylprolyl isomerase